MKTNIKIFFNFTIFSFVIKSSTVVANLNIATSGMKASHDNIRRIANNLSNMRMMESGGYKSSSLNLNMIDLRNLSILQPIDTNDPDILFILRNQNGLYLNPEDHILSIFNNESGIYYILMPRSANDVLLREKYIKFLIGDEVDFELKKYFSFYKISQEDFFNYFNLIQNIKYMLYTYSKYKGDQEFGGSQTHIIFGKNIRSEKDFITSSGVLITNEWVWVNEKNKAYISKGKKSILFEIELKRYFYSNKNFDYIKNAVIKSYQKDKTTEDQQYDPLFKSHYELKNIAIAIDQGVQVDDSTMNIFEKSEILAIYDVLKDGKDKNSIVWVLAKDKETNKNFHWLIDLRDDISVLLK